MSSTPTIHSTKSAAGLSFTHRQCLPSTFTQRESFKRTDASTHTKIVSFHMHKCVCVTVGQCQPPLSPPLSGCHRRPTERRWKAGQKVIVDMQVGEKAHLVDPRRKNLQAIGVHFQHREGDLETRHEQSLRNSRQPIG